MLTDHQSQRNPKIPEMADIRDKTIISLMALGGFREGTLYKLKYRHVKKDLEAGIVPLNIHVEAEIKASTVTMIHS